jgi:hypothetical protein
VALPAYSNTPNLDTFIGASGGGGQNMEAKRRNGGRPDELASTQGGDFHARCVLRRFVMARAGPVRYEDRCFLMLDQAPVHTGSAAGLNFCNSTLGVWTIQKDPFAFIRGSTALFSG